MDCDGIDFHSIHHWVQGKIRNDQPLTQYRHVLAEEGTSISGHIHVSNRESDCGLDALPPQLEFIPVMAVRGGSIALHVRHL